MPATFSVLSPFGINELLLYYTSIDLGSEITDFDPGKKKLTINALSLANGIDFLEFELTGKFSKDGTSGTATDIRIYSSGESLAHISGANLDISKLIKRNDAALETGEMLQGRVFPLLFGHGSDMIMNGSDSQDVLIATGGRISGRGGDDHFLEATPKAVTRYDGGNDTDTVSYFLTLEKAVRASLFDAESNTGWAAGDRYINIENLVGGDGGDTLEGNDAANRLDAGGGNDTLIGRGGADELVGGEGLDFASYASAVGTGSAGLAIVMRDTSRSTGDAAGDTFDGIEGIIGSNSNDTIIGDAEANILIGGRGDDVIDGHLGADELWGDSKAFGVDGDDTFVFNGPKEGVKAIMDFDVFDHIQVSRGGFGLHIQYEIKEGTTLIVADSNPTALTNSPTFLVEKSTGNLLFDADGNGSGTAELIATVKFHSQKHLDVNDFLIV